jgi:hypothetical protein
MNLDFLTKILFHTGQSDDSFKRELIRAEAEIGGQLFGPIPKGHRRQFFCFDLTSIPGSGMRNGRKMASVQPLLRVMTYALQASLNPAWAKPTAH